MASDVELRPQVIAMEKNERGPGFIIIFDGGLSGIYLNRLERYFMSLFYLWKPRVKFNEI